MKAAVTTGEKKKITVREMPIPEVQPGTILLKTKYCSICGSDLEYLDGTFEATKPFDKGNILHAGAILGHEWSAEVADVGKGVQGWSVGNRATIVGMGRQLPPCGACYYCRRGMWDSCIGENPVRGHIMEIRPGGYGGTGGAMAEYFLKPWNGAQKIPDGVSFEQAAMLEPFGIGVRSVQVSEIKDGDSLVIIGAGRIGLSALLYARMIGASPIIITDVVQSRLDLALKLGADTALNVSKVNVLDEVIKLTEAGPDAVCVVARNGEVFNHAVEMVRWGGTVALTGFIPPVVVNPGEWVDKRIKIVTSVGGPKGVNLLRMMDQKLIDPTPIISAIMPLEAVQEAFDSMYDGKNIAVLLKP